MKRETRNLDPASCNPTRSHRGGPQNYEGSQRSKWGAVILQAFASVGIVGMLGALGGCDEKYEDDSDVEVATDTGHGREGKPGSKMAAGTCQSPEGNYCGGEGNGSCWCDDMCAEYGDCCHDYRHICEAGDGDDDDDEPTTGPDASPSPGCGQAPLHSSGGVNVTINAGPDGDGDRRFYLSLPPGYDPSKPHKLIVGYPGTNWVGEQIQPYLQLESHLVTPKNDEIFVYPDPLWRDFPGWSVMGGWLLGPYAAPANGDQDLEFTEAILDYMEDNYCVDSERVFATGHSWGGDMAHVVSCFLGDRFTASVPVAANRPYWFEDGGGFINCPGDTAVWTMYGQYDTHFGGDQRPGLEGRDFWLDERGCNGSGDYIDLGLGSSGECVEYQGCSSPTRFCLYGAEYGHQTPSGYFAEATMDFFRSF